MAMNVGPFENVHEQIADLGNKHYDANAIGGTTNIILDIKSKEVLKEYLSLSGTMQIVQVALLLGEHGYLAKNM